MGLSLGSNEGCNLVVDEELLISDIMIPKTMLFLFMMCIYLHVFAQRFVRTGGRRQGWLYI